MVFVNEAKPLRHNPGIGGKVKIPVFSTCVSLELQTHTTKITMTEPQHDFNHDHAHTVVVVLLGQSIVHSRAGGASVAAEFAQQSSETSGSRSGSGSYH